MNRRLASAVVRACVNVRHQSGNFKPKPRRNLSLSHQNQPALHPVDFLNGAHHVGIVVAGRDDVVRIMRNGARDGALKRHALFNEPPDKPESDATARMMSFDNG